LKEKEGGGGKSRVPTRDRDLESPPRGRGRGSDEEKGVKGGPEPGGKKGEGPNILRVQHAFFGKKGY